MSLNRKKGHPQFVVVGSLCIPKRCVGWRNHYFHGQIEARHRAWITISTDPPHFRHKMTIILRAAFFKQCGPSSIRRVCINCACSAWSQSDQIYSVGYRLHTSAFSFLGTQTIVMQEIVGKATCIVCKQVPETSVGINRLKELCLGGVLLSC